MVTRIAFPSIGRKFFKDAHASNNVPATVKWFSDRSLRRRACSSTATRNFLATSFSSSISLFLENVEALGWDIVLLTFGFKHALHDSTKWKSGST